MKEIRAMSQANNRKYLEDKARDSLLWQGVRVAKLKAMESLLTSMSYIELQQVIDRTVTIYDLGLA